MHEYSSQKIVDDLIDKKICLTHLVNNARSLAFVRPDSSGHVSRYQFTNELTLDVIVPYELSLQCSSSPSFQLESIVNIGSQYGIVAPNLSLYNDPKAESPIHYGVSKAALGHLTKELAVRLASSKVRVNCVAFGGVAGRVDAEFLKRYRNYAQAIGC